MKTIIVWFKTDLRLHDNETLVKAIAQGEAIVPIYCFDDSHFVESEYGFQKTGSFRAKFLLESVANLDENPVAVVDECIRFLIDVIPQGLNESEDTDLLNIRDEMLAILNQTKYRLDLR